MPRRNRSPITPHPRRVFQSSPDNFVDSAEVALRGKARQNTPVRPGGSAFHSVDLVGNFIPVGFASTHFILRFNFHYTSVAARAYVCAWDRHSQPSGEHIMNLGRRISFCRLDVPARIVLAIARRVGSGDHRQHERSRHQRAETARRRLPASLRSMNRRAPATKPRPAPTAASQFRICAWADLTPFRSIYTGGAAAFAPQTRENLMVTLGASTDVNVNVEAITIAEEVTVSGQADPVFASTRTGRRHSGQPRRDLQSSDDRRASSNRSRA